MALISGSHYVVHRMSQAFQADYSAYYDLLYRDKDYAGEAAYVAGLLRRFAPGASDVLDVACGTGRHLVEMSKLGFRMHGADQSSGMLEAARQRAAKAGITAEFHHVPFQKLGTLTQRYGAVTSLFSAVNYLTTYADLAATLDGVRQILKTAGAFVFDIWNGNAVLDHHSPVRVKDIQDGKRRLLRTSETTLDTLKHTAHVHYHMVLTEADRVIADFTEDHHVRYYFPQEMTDYLGIHGFDVVYVGPFMEPDRALAPLDWNVTYVARPRRSA